MEKRAITKNTAIMCAAWPTNVRVYNLFVTVAHQNAGDAILLFIRKVTLWFETWFIC